MKKNVEYNYNTTIFNTSQLVHTFVYSYITHLYYTIFYLWVIIFCYQCFSVTIGNSLACLFILLHTLHKFAKL